MATASITSKAFAAGEKVFSEGEPGFALYVIRSGKIIISQRSTATSEMVAILGPGEIVGEMAVASGAPRSATATAAVDCVLTVFPKELIDQRIEEADPILKMLLLTAFERLRVLSVQSNRRVINS